MGGTVPRSGEEPSTIQGHSSVDLRAERALNPVDMYSLQATSQVPKKKNQKTKQHKKEVSFFSTSHNKI